MPTPHFSAEWRQKDMQRNKPRRLGETGEMNWGPVRNLSHHQKNISGEKRRVVEKIRSNYSGNRNLKGIKWMQSREGRKKSKEPV